MKTLILIFSVGFIMVSLHAQSITENDVPERVKSSFTKMFPDAVLTSWNKKGTEFEARFLSWNRKCSAVFTSDGKWKERKATIPPANLPFPAKLYIKKHYKNLSIQYASKITKAIKEIQYEVALNSKKILFDEYGILLKKD